MKETIQGRLLEARFIKRLNRFIAEIEVNGDVVLAHVANTGRMKELLVEGVKIIVRYVQDEKRKTNYDLLMVYKNNDLVAIDSKLPNILLEKAFKENAFTNFNNFTNVQREVTFGNSRFDLAINDGKQFALIEAKCVTYIREDGVASFPDAPTDRGRKHVLELIQAMRQGIRSAVFFIVQREDAQYFTPNRTMDPKFADSVEEAYLAGVEFYAFLCKVKPGEVEIWNEIPVII